ncbi:MAG: DNA repair protein RecN [Candidatus Riflebacteria bacterium]|nr:DNA repair protein RecN [Candidatus Riflebacteria bacterium]
MIIDLEVENFLFIRKSCLDFSKQLNVITGETGAGKSVLLEAIKLVLGKKGKSGVVLKGKNLAKVQANFKINDKMAVYSVLSDAGLLNEEDQNSLSISRTFKFEGSEKTFINGILANLSLLKEIGKSLIEIHGQNEHQTLLDSKTQKNLLDRFCGEVHLKKLEELKKVYSQRKKIIDEIEALEKNLKNSSERLEKLHEIKEELEKLDLNSPEEEENLKDEAKRLQNSEQIATSLETAIEMLSGMEEKSGIIDRIRRARESLKNIMEYDTVFAALYERLDSLFNECREIEREIAGEASNAFFDPARNSEIQERLNLIGRACRKYGCDVQTLITMKAETEKEISELSAPDSTRAKLEKELEKIDKQFSALTGEISEQRKKNAEKLQKLVMKELATLGFAKVLFEVSLIKTTPGADGGENIEFVASLNPGAPPGSLKKIASGGELSRIALSIKRVLSDSDEIPTLIFDEVDTGIGGETAEAVAKSLKALSKNKQVILVTHLHQIAKEGDRHFTVNKSVENDETLVKIESTSGKVRELEIARMLGDTGENGIAFARSILK